MKHILVYLSLSLFFTSSFAQSDIDNLIKGSKADANYLVAGYASPALNAVSFGLNQGWYNTAKPHKLLGVDLTITASPVYLSSSDLNFAVDNGKLTTIKLISNPSTVGLNATANVPTIFGEKTATQYQKYSNGQLTGTPFDGAPGLKLDIPVVGNAVPMAMVQLGIGLPKGTDLKLRFFPSTKLGSNGNVSMFGFGIMHDIKQHIPGIKKLPFDLSGFFGYTKLKLDAALDNNLADPDAAGRKAAFETTAMTIQGLISKKISVLTFYGGIGYNINSSSLSVKGKYDSGSVVDPVDINSNQSGPRMTAGMRLKLAVFTFHGDYTLQKYNSLSLGFGINVR